jgi:hypothetical protein
MKGDLSRTNVLTNRIGYRCQTADLWRLLLAAAARRSTTEAVCADLPGAPDPILYAAIWLSNCISLVLLSWSTRESPAGQLASGLAARARK